MKLKLAIALSLLSLTACTEEMVNTTLSDVKPTESYIAFTASMKGNMPSCFVSISPDNPEQKPLYFITTTGDQSKIFAVPPGTYRFTEVGCGRTKSKLVMTDMLPPMTVQANAVNFMGAFSVSADRKGDFIQIHVDRDLKADKAEQTFKVLEQQKSLPVVSAYTGKPVTKDNWKPINHYPARVFNGPSGVKLKTLTPPHESEKVCYDAEQKVNLLFSGRVKWQVNYEKGKPAEVTVTKHDDLLTLNFFHCMESVLKQTELSDNVSGSVTFSLN